MSVMQVERLNEIALRIVKNESRTEIVHSLMDESITPDMAQQYYDAAVLYAEGQGHFGFQKWFMRIVFNKTQRPKGGALVWLAGLISMLICLPINFWIYQGLPPGRYSPSLIAIPGIVVAFILTMIIGSLIYKYYVSKN